VAVVGSAQLPLDRVVVGVPLGEKSVARASEVDDFCGRSVCKGTVADAVGEDELAVGVRYGLGASERYFFSTSVL